MLKEAPRLVIQKMEVTALDASGKQNAISVLDEVVTWPCFSAALASMLAGFGEFERDLIRERQREGIAIAKARGVYKGRKKALGPVEAHELVVQAHAGIPKADLARAYGISRETVYQYLRQN